MRITSRCLLASLSGIALFCFSAGVPCFGAEPLIRRIVMRADEALEKGMGVVAVQRNPAGDGVVLYDTTLIEDDGPGIGPDANSLERSQKAPTVVVGGNVRLKKVLNVSRPEALAARLYVPPGIAVEVNDTPVQIADNTKYPQIPPSLLRKGDNVVVLSGSPQTRHSLKIAPRNVILQNAPDRKDRPPRSFKSGDGGRNWEAIDGEAMVRLHLLQYAVQGSFISPVIDLRVADGEPAIAGPVSIQSVALGREADVPAGASIELAVRSGTSPVYEPAFWSGWQSPAAAIPADRGYLQWKATLKSLDPKATPTLRSVTVDARVARSEVPAWASRIKAVALHNADIRYTSIPFEYEDPSHPRMAALRRKYKLDEVVSGSDTELEKLVKLRDWVSRQWEYHPPAEGGYPAWDADEILSRKDGFCVSFRQT